VNQAKPNASLAVTAVMLNDRSGLWQITPERVALLRGVVNHLTMRSRLAVEEMLRLAAAGERFWQPSADAYFALNEVKKRSLSVDKKTIDTAISEVIACAKRDGVAHREWVKNVVDVLARLSNEK